MDATLHTTADAVARLAAARPLLVDVVPASEISAHHAAGGVSHAGPPIEPARMCAPMRAALGSALWPPGRPGGPGAGARGRRGLAGGGIGARRRRPDPALDQP